MLFNLFKKKAKDHRHFLTVAGKHLAAERFAEARVEFLEALKLCPADALQDAQEIRQGLAAAGDSLGELNISEGRHAVNSGDAQKAFDHFTLACELALDQGIKAAAREELRKLQQEPPAKPAAHKGGHHHHGGSSCGSCKDSGSKHSLEEDDMLEPDLNEEERFSLLVQPLPGNLAKRYAEIGGEFINAYLLIHDGDDAAAYPILQQLLRNKENDIVIYELALIMYRAGKIHECEKYLYRSLELNDRNPATYLALVHLFAETGRYPEAIKTVNHMMELEVLPEQAQLMLGDLQHSTGDEAGALESWSKLLPLPAMAKTAAERLVPLLSNQGRTEEAKFLAKQYLKGCC
jgi:tetratricopeptide (TPR) repeat protein